MSVDYHHPIDVADDITPDQFQEKYWLPEKPVILRGYFKKYPAFEKWNINYLKEHLGNKEVGVFNEKKSAMDRSFKNPHEKMKFAQYLDLITTKPTDLRIFLFNPFTHKPDLRNDFDFPDLCPGFLTGRRFQFMFFGGANSVVRIHQDMDWSNVFLTQLHGKKHVVLFSPEYSTFLYRYPFNVHSSVDIENPDFKKHPGLKFIKGSEGILEPGDTLFMPSGYWHYIKYLEGGWAVNMRSLSPHVLRRFRGLYNVGLLTHIDEMMRGTLGKRWFEYKEAIAHRRANQKLKLVTKQCNRNKAA
jgi:hypothetical protein